MSGGCGAGADGGGRPPGGPPPSGEEREHRSMTGQPLFILEQWLAQREQREREQRDDRPPG